MNRKTVILGTGGTISGRASSAQDHVGYKAGEVSVADIVGGIDALRDVPLATEQVAQLDSKDMTHAVWRRLALRIAHWLEDDSVSGVVVTHGTDTLEETAYFIERVLAPRKPVVFTCAMRPATALAPDGPQNLLDAVTVARAPGAAGVSVVCAGELHAAASVRKIHTYRLDAFSSGDDGLLGLVEPAGLRLLRPWPAPAAAAQSQLLHKEPSLWPRVEIVASHAGASGRLVDLLVADGARGLVAAATGNGTLHSDLEDALRRAMASGVAVRRATRCALGRIHAVAGADVPDAGALTPAQARVALMIDLA